MTRGSESESAVLEFSPEEIRAELSQILSSERFRNAEQLRTFLSYIVEKTLEGHGDELKEAVVAIEAFHRGSSFDARLDAFVRVQAGRLRAALAAYYTDNNHGSTLRIEVPKGSYAPVFSRCEALAKVGAAPPADERRKPLRAFASSIATAAVLLFMLGIAIWLFLRSEWTRSRFLRSSSLPERGTIVVADFTNTTRDPVFDGTIKQALLMDLEQSPALSFLPEQQVQETLNLMRRPSGETFTSEIAREVCQRNDGWAVLSGSIAGLGTQYVIGLTASDCASGKVLAREQARADGKEQVLTAVDNAVTDLRTRLGESLATLQKYATPLEQASTSSLKALQAYSDGISTRNTQGDMESAPYFQRAIDLDPNFAVAYDELGVVWWDALKFDSATQNFRKAFALREHVSQRERFRIEARYYHFVTGELEKALDIYREWEREYPRDWMPYIDAGMVYNALGEYEQGLREYQRAQQLNPRVGFNYTNLAQVLLSLDRQQQARASLDEMKRRNLSSPDEYLTQYQLAFLQGDTAQMQRQAARGSETAEISEILLLIQAQTEAGLGRIAEMRRLVGAAVGQASMLDEHERVAEWQAYGALLEAEIGNPALARQQASSALRLSFARDTRILAALALARAGEVRKAKILARELAQEYPADTILSRYWLPVMDASIELHAGDAAQAIARLEITRGCELGQSSLFQIAAFAPMYPVYLRGQAFLRQGQGALAATEFKRILDHPGLIQNFPLGALAAVELARAYTLEGDLDKARYLYREFLARGKDADPNTPIYQQAQAEYSKLN